MYRVKKRWVILLMLLVWTNGIGISAGAAKSKVSPADNSAFSTQAVESKSSSKPGTKPEATAEASLEAQEEKPKVPWRGSTVSLQNSFTALSLAPGAELTYNPYYAMTLKLRPSWWFNDNLGVQIWMDVVTELTDSDITTYSREPLLGDLMLRGVYNDIYTIPKADIKISADVFIVTPTSKMSLARTSILTLKPGVLLKRKFDVLEGLNLSYTLRFGLYWHRYTTAQRDTPLIPTCSSTQGGCDAFLNTGIRNTAFQLTQALGVELQLLEWLSAYMTYGHIIDFLYRIDNDDPRISHQPQEPQNQRYISLFDLGVSYSPLKTLSVSLGYQALYPHLSPDSTYYTPFFNRYGVIYCDLTLNVEGLIQQIKGE